MTTAVAPGAVTHSGSDHFAVFHAPAGRSPSIGRARTTSTTQPVTAPTPGGSTFGPYEDDILAAGPVMSDSLLSPSRAWREGRSPPLDGVEGFVRTRTRETVRANRLRNVLAQVPDTVRTTASPG